MRVLTQMEQNKHGFHRNKWMVVGYFWIIGGRETGVKRLSPLPQLLSHLQDGNSSERQTCIVESNSKSIYL